MNKAHSSHHTLSPDPAIPHVLHGWGTRPDESADHDLELKEPGRTSRSTTTWN